MPEEPMEESEMSESSDEAVKGKKRGRKTSQRRKRSELQKAPTMRLRSTEGIVRPHQIPRTRTAGENTSVSKIFLLEVVRFTRMQGRLIQRRVVNSICLLDSTNCVQTGVEILCKITW